MMDCLGLLGEKPIIPPPPKVCPLSPVPVPVPDPAPAPAIPAVDPAVDASPVVLPLPPLALFAPCACAALGSGVATCWLKLPPPVRLLPPGSPFPPLGPMPATVAPPSGIPKKPMAVGALFSPNLIGFQSSLPVVRSVYFLRRKRMLFVFTSASTLGGYAPNFL